MLPVLQRLGDAYGFSSDGVAVSYVSNGLPIRFVLPVLWMTSCIHVMARGASCAFLSGY